jgi:hypothetical protein
MFPWRSFGVPDPLFGRNLVKCLMEQYRYGLESLPHVTYDPQYWLLTLQVTSMTGIRSSKIPDLFPRYYFLIYLNLERWIG